MFKKRRYAKPNKNAAKMRRRSNKGRSSGSPLRTVLPSVSHLTLTERFTSPEGMVVSEETRRIGPNDSCDLVVPCPGSCGGIGTFDLSGKINETIDARLETAEGNATCDNPRFGGNPLPCGYAMKCLIKIVYSEEEAVETPASEPEPAPETEPSDTPS